MSNNKAENNLNVQITSMIDIKSQLNLLSKSVSTKTDKNVDFEFWMTCSKGDQYSISIAVTTSSGIVNG